MQQECRSPMVTGGRDIVKQRRGALMEECA